MNISIKSIQCILLAAFLLKIGAGNAQLFVPGGGMIDASGNEYSTIIYNNEQEWTTQNLRTTQYANGDEITHIPNAFDWTNTTVGAWASYNNNIEFDLGYGKLYNALAVIDTRNLCPSGWRVPSDDDFKELELFLGFSPAEVNSSGGRFNGHGGEFKVTGFDFWNSPNVGSSNLNGFSAKGHGNRSASSGAFNYQNVNGAIWTSTNIGNVTQDFHWFRSFHYWFNVVYRNSATINTGLGVRCLKSDITTSTENQPQKEFMIYPNPTSDRLYIKNHSNNAAPTTYSLRSVMGVIVQSGTLRPTDNPIDVSGLSSGIYLLQIGENQQTVKVIKQ